MTKSNISDSYSLNRRINVLFTVQCYTYNCH